MSAIDIDGIAAEALAAFDTRKQIEPFTACVPKLDVGTVYAIAAAALRIRQERGEKPVGRKIGFTNRSIWTQFNVDAPIWGYMYDTSLATLKSDEAVSLAAFCEPQIEPEIAFKLATAPAAGMNERELLDCVAWIAHGFEIVQSIYPGWTFKVPDTIVNFGMHGAYRLGEPLMVTPQNCDVLFESLPAFTVALSRDGATIDTGKGANVLGGPLSALRHLVELLANDPHNPPLAAGEIVTTGTLTRAFPVKPGETWATGISGIPLDGRSIRFG